MPFLKPTVLNCSLTFTERYGEFTFGNDTVTAVDLNCAPSQDSHSKQPDPRRSRTVEMLDELHGYSLARAEYNHNGANAAAAGTESAHARQPSSW